MINLNSSIIVFYRRDTDDRERNLKTLINWYEKHFNNYQFIIIEQETESDNSFIYQYDNIYHEYSNYKGSNKSEWNKMAAYNQGVKCSHYENLIFNDIDVIFNPQCIQEALDIISKENKRIILPNDGHYICIKEKLRDKFNKDENFNYQFLLDYVDKEHYNTLNYENENILVGALTTPGGGFITKKRNIFNCNGFNINFIGWGYEDNETLLRFNKMGYPVGRLSKSLKPLFHINHAFIEREHNPYYKTNENIFKLVNKIDSKLLYLYSNTWKM